MFWTGANRKCSTNAESFLRKIKVAVRACRRKRSFKRESVRYLCCSGNGNWCGLIESLERNRDLLVQRKLNFYSLTKLSFFSKILSILSNTTSHQPPPFYETHNLLSAQIRACLFIKTRKSLRSKTAVSHRFKILRAIWHKVAGSHKDFLIGIKLAF